ncbi:asialoglycoprotein receptor 1-like isoform X2 [Sebastes umbrosus]|uniref:asialoglycoprotein receptor 1-like isoform X2 n=1 Tax=Sebastes umbrosus TaxID=72105 RepID=UPI00189E6A72|nr:asialoglycoprotein receptor 1-like isoform X2 [Sebastes umbrosus]
MQLMEVDDDELHVNKNLTMQGLLNSVDFQRKKQPSRCASVCLGLLCAVLLAGNIGQLVYYEIISRSASADPTQASYIQGGQEQSSYDALTAERKQLDARLTNLTKEKDLLQQSYSSVTTERDEFKASFNNLKNESDQLQVSYNTLKQESDQLQTNKDQLQTKYSSLLKQKDELQTLSVTLRANRDQLQSNYSSLKINKDQLQRSYNTLSLSKIFLQTRYNSLEKDKERLQSSYNTLQREKEQLQTKYTSLAAARDQLQKKIDKVRAKPCQTGWSKFDISCYFVSNLEKNWTQSRQYCIAEGADLVVIDSRDEQAFVNGLLDDGKNAWTGMTDSIIEGIWMWVDGTPVTTTYWGEDQPNSYDGNQDCGETVQKSLGVGEWNDDGCFGDQNFICEK